MKNALISVFHKDGIVEFAQELKRLGFTIYASGGTFKHLQANGVEAKPVSELVGGEAILGHRVVTLSREVHAGLLAKHTAEDLEELAKLLIPWLDLVCVDLYPLEAEIAKPGSTRESVIEQTDIGGPTMIRSGVKGQRIVLCDMSDREPALRWIEAGCPNKDKVIGELGAKAEFIVAKYVLASAQYLGDGEYAGLMGQKVESLCYGENRRQGNAALFTTGNAHANPLSLNRLTQIEGTEPSFINMTDVHRALETANRIGAGWELNFERVPLIGVAVKHGNACGAAVGNLEKAVIKKVIEGDPEAITGSVIVFNFWIDGERARLLREYQFAGLGNSKKRIFDGVIAPGFTSEAVEELARKHTGKCRLFKHPVLEGEGLGLKSLDTTPKFRQVRGGFLRQDGDPVILRMSEEWKSVLTWQEQADLVLGWGLCSTSNSNTITLTKNGMLIGQGANQRSRKMAAKVALLYVESYGHSAVDAICCSDSFFVDPDGPEVLHKAGVKKIFATSGSINDASVRKACDEWGMTLLQLPDAEARGFFGH